MSAAKALQGSDRSDESDEKHEKIAHSTKICHSVFSLPRAVRRPVPHPAPALREHAHALSVFTERSSRMLR
jgi:hypothetical protein